MQQLPAHIDHAGHYRCRILTHGLRTSKEEGGKGISVALKLEILSQWMTPKDGEPAWEPYNEGYYVIGDFWIRKKDGTPHQGAIDQLSRAGAMPDGLETFTKEPDPGLIVIAQVKTEPYDGKLTIKASWLYPADHVPQEGGIAGAASGEKLERLIAEFAPTVRALMPAAVPKATPPAADEHSPAQATPF